MFSRAGGRRLIFLAREGAMTKRKDEIAAETPPATKPPGYDKLMALLKQVLNVPPLKRNK